MPKQSSLFPESNYAALLDSLKGRIRSSQVKAVLAINQELIGLYWHIGQEILTRQKEEGWGPRLLIGSPKT